MFDNQSCIAGVKQRRGDIKQWRGDGKQQRGDGKLDWIWLIDFKNWHHLTCIERNSEL